MKCRGGGGKEKVASRLIRISGRAGWSREHAGGLRESNNSLIQGLPATFFVGASGG